LNDDYPDNSNTSLNRHASHTQSKHNDISSGKGFVLLANDDPELTDDDYLSTNNKSSRTPTTSSDSGMQTKKQHYLKRQNTLLKEWEVMNKKEFRKTHKLFY